MNRLFIVALVALLASPVAVLGRGLKQGGQTGTACETESFAGLTITAGTGTAAATSFCNAEAMAKNNITTIVVDWVDDVYDDPETECTVRAASAVGEAVATAYAAAYTSVTTTVDIQGEGEACASGFAGGDSFAVALVDLLVQVVVAETGKVDEDVSKELEDFDDKEVEIKNGSSATGEAIGRAVSTVLASAWAAAVSESCSTGGFKEDFQDAYVASVKDAVAFLYAEVVITVCDSLDVDTDDLTEFQSSLSDSTSFVTGSVTEEGSTIVETTEMADGSGQSEQLRTCDAIGAAQCCRSLALRSGRCTCGAGCEAEPFEGQIDVPDDANTIWKLNGGDEEFCFCL